MSAQKTPGVAASKTQETPEYNKTKKEKKTHTQKKRHTKKQKKTHQQCIRQTNCNVYVGTLTCEKKSTHKHV